MITDNPTNDAISEMNRLDAIQDEVEINLCYVCQEEFDNCIRFDNHNYCPQCLNELKIENQIN